jgi:tetratricopeptide (TPR) repeat protein
MWLHESYEDIYLHAEQLYKEGKYEDAIHEHQRVVDRIMGLKPELRQRRPELDEILVLSVAGLVAALRRLERYDEALALYDRLIAFTPLTSQTQSMWMRERAITRIIKGEKEEGLDELRALAVTATGDIDTWLALGLESVGLGHYDEAEEHLRRAIDLGGESDRVALAYWALFTTYRETGRLEEALATWEQLSSTLEPYRDYWEPPCRMLIEAGDLARAREYVKREGNRLRGGLVRGLLAQAEGNEKQAFREWQQVNRQDPYDYRVGFNAWAEATLRLGKAEETLDVLGYLASEKPSPRRFFLLAIAEANIGHADHAERALRDAVHAAHDFSRRPGLSKADWQLFDELVSDAALKAKLRSSFALENEGLPGFKTV